MYKLMFSHPAKSIRITSTAFSRHMSDIPKLSISIELCFHRPNNRFPILYVRVMVSQNGGSTLHTVALMLISSRLGFSVSTVNDARSHLHHTNLPYATLYSFNLAHSRLIAWTTNIGIPKGFIKAQKKESKRTPHLSPNPYATTPGL